jgi:hypothetical protein
MTLGTPFLSATKENPRCCEYLLINGLFHPGEVLIHLPSGDRTWRHEPAEQFGISVRGLRGIKLAKFFQQLARRHPVSHLSIRESRVKLEGMTGMTMRFIVHRQHVSSQVSGQHALTRARDRRLCSLFTIQPVTRGAVELDWRAEIFCRFPAVARSIGVSELSVGEHGSCFCIGRKVQSTGQVKRVVKPECAGITPLPLPVPGEDGELGMMI